MKLCYCTNQYKREEHYESIVGGWICSPLTNTKNKILFDRKEQHWAQSCIYFLQYNNVLYVVTDALSLSFAAVWEMKYLSPPHQLPQ